MCADTSGLQKGNHDPNERQKTGTGGHFNKVKLSYNPNSHLHGTCYILGTVLSMSHITHLDAYNNPMYVDGCIIIEWRLRQREVIYSVTGIQKVSANLSL